MKFSSALILLAGLAAVCASGQTQTPVFSTGQAARLVIGQTNFTAGNFGATNTLLGSPSGIAYANGTSCGWPIPTGSAARRTITAFCGSAMSPLTRGPPQDPTIIGSTCGVCRGQASLVLGQPDFISNNCPHAHRYAQPDRDRDRREHRGRCGYGQQPRPDLAFAPESRTANPPDVVVGQPDFTHNGTSVPPTATSLRGPTGVWIAGGKLYVADTQDNRILIYNKIPTNEQRRRGCRRRPAQLHQLRAAGSDAGQRDHRRQQHADAGFGDDGRHTHVRRRSGAEPRPDLQYDSDRQRRAADIALGQPDLITAISNNSFTSTATRTLDADSNSRRRDARSVPVECRLRRQPGPDRHYRRETAIGTTLYPAALRRDDVVAPLRALRRYAAFCRRWRQRSRAGLQFDPDANGLRADAILGEPDEFSDNTGQNPDGTDALQTPVSLAFDGLNLYVSDTYNRRVVVYTPEPLNIPLGRRPQRRQPADLRDRQRRHRRRDHGERHRRSDQHDQRATPALHLHGGCRGYADHRHRCSGQADQ